MEADTIRRIKMNKIVANRGKVEIAPHHTGELHSSHLKIRTLYSVISPGTELTIIENSHHQSITLGYSAMGVIEELGADVKGFVIGERVAVYGAPYVQHAEILHVPKTLCVKVPERVESKEAALGGIGAIAIHALRIADLRFGETCVIVGLGLLGQMIAQIADAAGYRVVACDLHDERAAMTRRSSRVRAVSSLGALEEEISSCTDGHGADAVLLCAGGKKSSLTSQSLEWIRNKGKVVIVGDIEPDFPRHPMFSKEAQLLISRAGGPGRYDQSYEADAVDYPYGFVRWTEGRNLAEYIRLVSEKRIDVTPFIQEVVGFSEVTGVFSELMDKKTSTLTKVIDYAK